MAPLALYFNIILQFYYFRGKWTKILYIWGFMALKDDPKLYAVSKLKKMYSDGKKI